VSYLLLGLGLAFILEGLVYALAPSLIERMLETLKTLPERAIQQLGALAAVLGVILVWAAFQLGL
jgi:uncharacterized protein YjeT (DUF2065 family)